MVDLRESLRLMETSTPLPITEISARVRRRKRRRVFVSSSLAAVCIVGIAVALSAMPDLTSDESVADRPVPTSGVRPDEEEHQSSGLSIPAEDAPTTTSPPAEESPASSVEPGSALSVDTTPAAPAPEPENGTPASQQRTTPGIQTVKKTTSEWESGYCAEIEVINSSAEEREWQVVLDVDGTVTTVWSATAEEIEAGTYLFAGEKDYNETVERGANTSFGTCVEVQPK